MTSGLKPYSSYRASGVLWLGEVPEHWKVLPNRSLFTEVRKSGCPEEQLLSVTIRNGVVPQASLLRNSSKKDSSRQDKSAYKVVRRGDIAYNKMRAWQGAVGVSRYQGIVSPAYVVERSREGANSQYFHYLFRSPSFVKEAERWSYGITSDMWSLRPEHFRVIYSCVPPPPEQAAIVRFLEHVNRRISRYIRAKERLIELLEEQKQAIIHQVVTGKIDVRNGQPYSAYKDSGVEWLGRVPRHWSVVALRECGSVSGGMTPSMTNSRYWGGAIPWVTPKDMKRDVIDDSRVRVTRAAVDETSLRLIPAPAVLMVVRGMISWPAKFRSALTKCAGTVNQAFMKALVPTQGMRADFSWHDYWDRHKKRLYQ